MQSEKNTKESSVREQLILAGISEIKENGIIGFSQRRVAAACHLSCATPYKQFGSRDGLVRAILDYIDGQWEMFAKEIIGAYKGDSLRLLTELCVGYLRFLDANPKFRAVIFFCDENGTHRSPLMPSECTKDSIDDYAQKLGLDEKEKARRVFVAYSIILGATLLPKDGASLSEEQLDMVRKSIELAITSGT